MKDELKVNQIKYLWNSYDMLDGLEIYTIRLHLSWTDVEFKAQNLNIDFTRRDNYKSYEMYIETISRFRVSGSNCN